VDLPLLPGLLLRGGAVCRQLQAPGIDVGLRFPHAHALGIGALVGDAQGHPAGRARADGGVATLFGGTHEMALDCLLRHRLELLQSSYLLIDWDSVPCCQILNFCRDLESVLLPIPRFQCGCIE